MTIEESGSYEALRVYECYLIHWVMDKKLGFMLHVISIMDCPYFNEESVEEIFKKTKVYYGHLSGPTQNVKRSSPYFLRSTLLRER